MTLTEKDFAGPFPASMKPVRNGQYWSSPPVTGTPNAMQIYLTGECVKTSFTNGKWSYNSGNKCYFQNRVWIGLTAEAVERVAREMAK